MASLTRSHRSRQKPLASRQRLSDYFASELEELRTRAVEFSEEHPASAEELKLAGGKSRDPHIEMLMQSFAWMTSRLQLNLEQESRQVPTMLLQQLYPQLLAPLPSMAVVECDVDGSKATFEKRYTLQAGQSLEPLGLGQGNDAARLKQCRFTTCYDTDLVPLRVHSTGREPLNKHPSLEKLGAFSLLRLDLVATPEKSVDGSSLNQPLRFFISAPAELKLQVYDFLSQHVVGLGFLNQQGELMGEAGKEHFRFCGFADDERLFPFDPAQELGLTLVQDYFAFPDKFLFFEVSGYERELFPAASATEDTPQCFSVVIALDETLPDRFGDVDSWFRLNCIPVINLFEQTSEPVTLTHKAYRYRLDASHDFPDCHEIYQVRQLLAVDNSGKERELVPYFSLDRKDEADGEYRWVSQLEANHRRRVPGNDTWVSLFSPQYLRDCPLGETIFARTLSCNRTLCERFEPGQAFAVIGSAPVSAITLVTNPTRYRPRELGSKQLWRLLSQLSAYYVSLANEDLARDMLITILELYVHDDDLVGRRQVESIVSLSIADDVVPTRSFGWRGYHHGSRFTLKLDDRRFEGSALLFASVVHRFLTLFCHINSYVRLDMSLGDRRYSWQPMSGHKSLA